MSKNICILFLLSLSFINCSWADKKEDSKDTKIIKVVKTTPNGKKADANTEGDLVQTNIIVPASTNTVRERANREKSIIPDSFGITFYKPTYVLPAYYTGSPYNSVYAGNTPDGESLKSTEIKYQLSLKAPIWRNIFHYPSTLYLGYTQLSYWQAYNRYAFFRETDYEPELFLANEVNLKLYKTLRLNFINIGFDHQSNGFGNILERSWNRLYLTAIFSTDNWMISLQPWIILPNSTYNQQNPDLSTYMGHGELIVAFKFYNNVLAFQSRNLIESGGKRPGNSLTWTFPMTDYLKGEVQVYSGYGQSLIEYNHRTNSVGVGIAFSNWI